MGHAKAIFFCPIPLEPGEGSNGQISFNFNYNLTKSISKVFISNFVCVLTNERYKTYQTGFLFCHLGYTPGVELWGAGGAQGVNIFFFKHGHVAYQIDGDDEQKRTQVKFHPRVKLVTLG